MTGAARIAGVLTQGIILGLLLAWAELNLVAVATQALIFRYQGF